MARRRPHSSTPRTRTPEQTATSLRRLLAKGQELISKHVQEDEEAAFRTFGLSVLSDGFGSESPFVLGLAGAGPNTILYEDLTYFSDRPRESVRAQLRVLENALEHIEEECQRPQAIDNDVPLSSRVFVVHGRNEGRRETVARFLEKLRLNPLILHEEPNRGRTIIQKFIDHSDVSYAVVLLTGDDRGGLASENPEAYPLRARQNVILELGFFLGKLGIDRVVALYEDGVGDSERLSGRAVCLAR